MTRGQTLAVAVGGDFINKQVFRFKKVLVVHSCCKSVTLFSINRFIWNSNKIHFISCKKEKVSLRKLKVFINPDSRYHATGRKTCKKLWKNILFVILFNPQNRENIWMLDSKIFSTKYLIVVASNWLFVILFNLQNRKKYLNVRFKNIFYKIFNCSG